MSKAVASDEVVAYVPLSLVALTTQGDAGASLSRRAKGSHAHPERRRREVGGCVLPPPVFADALIYRSAVMLDRPVGVDYQGPTRS